MKFFISAAALALSVTAAQAATVDFGTNFDATDSAATTTSHGELFTAFDFGNGLTGTVSVVNGFNSQAQVGEARIFDTNETGTADPDLEGDFTNAMDSSDVQNFGKALIIQERAGVASAIPDDEGRGGIITFSFDNKIDLLGVTYLDGEKGAIVNSANDLLGSFGSGVSGDNKFVDLDLTASADAYGITGFSVQYNGSGAIGALDLQVSAVPLPAGLPLLAAGLIGLGYARSQRKKA